MAIVEPQPRVLEDGDAALIEGSTETPATGTETVETVEYATLLEDPKGKEQPAAVKPAASQPAAGTEEELPDEYRGKTPAQLAKMLKDSQSLIGRQGSELGELRKKVDFAIQASLEGIRSRKEAQATPAAQPAATPEEFDESEIFAKPKAAIDKLIENHPLIKEIRASMGQSAANAEAHRAQSNTERFNQAHPDAGDIMRDPEFRQWVGASRVRQALMQRAHTKFDFDAGDEVFSTWKALKGVKQSSSAGTQSAAAATGEDAVSAAARTLAAAKAAKTAQAAAAAATSAAAVPSGSAAAGGKSGGAKKVYRRADIVRLMEEDPDRYEALSDEITAAYREGRVR
jgi:hypothetical protein